MMKILVVDDEEGMRKSLSILLESEGYLVTQAASGKEALKALAEDAVDLVIADMRMDAMSGIDLLEHIQNRRIEVPVIIMTAYGTIQSAVTAMQMGAYDFIIKPFEYIDILYKAKRAIDWAVSSKETSGRVRAEAEATRALSYKETAGMVMAKAEAPEDSPMIMGESQAIKNLKDMIRKFSMNDFPVLITGETGTGKNLCAKAIHRNGSRSKGPFVSVNCSCIPEHLLESELFGHTKGAFTGAAVERTGLFEAANGGTIVFDEIGTIPKAVQSKLLGVLQDKVIRKIGSNKESPVDARVIAATNIDLYESVQQGDFREDLYYRIKVLHMDVPPLRKRKEDIAFLAQHFLSISAPQLKKSHVAGFTPEAIERLTHYDYPGNVRELQNIVYSSVAISEEDYIGYYDLPASVLIHGGIQMIEVHDAALKSEEREKRMIIQSLKKHPDNLSAVARDLKIGRTTLWRKIRRYMIDIDQYKNSF
jgi:DNA-binding NtrC family response regulator